MPDPVIQSLIGEIRKMNLGQQSELYRQLATWISEMETWLQQPATLQQVREARFSEGLRCPRCSAGEVKRNGRLKDKKGTVKQRYLCKACGRTFSDLTATPLAHSKRQSLWGKYARCMVEGLSIRKCAEKVGVCVRTAFFWRHKILAGLRTLDKPTLAGIIEADETYFRYSEKGQRELPRPARKRGEPATKRGLSREQVCVVVARDRHSLTVAEICGRGVPKVSSVKRVLEPVVGTDSVLCTDGSSSYRRFCQDRGIAHYPITRKRASGSIYHINNVNGWHSRLKGWMVRFKGVATKYLNNYLEWHRFLDATSKVGEVAASKQLVTEACSALRPALKPLAQPLSA